MPTNFEDSSRNTGDVINFDPEGTINSEFFHFKAEFNADFDSFAGFLIEAVRSLQILT